MPDYIRLKHQGGTYFFTVNLLQRKDNDLLLKNIHLLREAVRTVRAKYPFHIHAWVVLPDHIHCIWQLPPDDDNFSVRWRLIKSYFSRGIESCETTSLSRQKRQERGIWQRRFWEHAIRNDDDFAKHMNYIHYNPVKHGYVPKVKDWEFSTFHHCVRLGIYDADWSG